MLWVDTLLFFYEQKNHSPSKVNAAVWRVQVEFILVVFGPLRRPQNIAKPTVFHVVLRDIGKSFQLAITTPRLDLIGYGNATAQSWLS